MTQPYIITVIEEQEVNLEDFKTFKTDCKSATSSEVDAHSLCQRAAIIGDDLANYKACLEYTVDCAKTDAKKAYSTAYASIAGTVGYREAQAEQDAEYNRCLERAAKSGALMGRIEAARDFCSKMHYYYKNRAFEVAPKPLNNYNNTNGQTREW